MVDEVEIKNVGGRNGVASEATLAALVSSLSGSNSSRERQIRLESLARASNTRGLNEGGKQQGILTKALVGTAKSAGGLIKEFAVGGNRMGDFSQAVFGAESSITGLVRAVDGLIDNYRELTAVGASFNNSMFDFIKSSAETGMSLSEYGGFILQNSEKLRNLGGTVTEGAKRFGDISKILRQNFGTNLTRVGMSMSEMNDILIEYTDFSILRMGRETRSNSQLAKGAETYALELDKLSKLTGISRKQLAEEQKKQLSDQRVRVAMTKMDETQQQNMTSNLAFAGTYSQNFSEMLKDMIDNSPDSEDTRYLMTASETFNRLSREVENMSTEEFANFTATVGREVDKFSRENPFMDQIPGFQNIFNLGAELAALSEMTAEERKKRLAEIAKQDGVTAALLSFELALNNVKTFILDQILALGPDFSELATELFDLTGVSEEAGGIFESMKTEAQDLITEGFAWLKTEIQEFTAYLKDGGDPTEYLMSGLRNVADSVYNWFKELFLGSTKEVGPGIKVYQAGLFENMASAFTSFWEGPTGTKLADTISGYFKNLVDNLILGINKSTGGLMFGDLSAEILKGRQASGGTLTPAQQATLTEENYEAQASELDEAALGITGLGLSAVDKLFGSELNKRFYDWSRSDAGLAAMGIGGGSTNSGPEGFRSQHLQGFATGTNGFQNFGNESTAKLHGVEAVVPRNTLAGDLLSRTFGNNWNSPKSSQSAAAPNQESLVKHVNQLNNTMLMVLSEIKTSNELGKKTISSVKGLNGDLYRGI